MAILLTEPLHAQLKGPVAILGGGVSGHGVRDLATAAGWASEIFDAKGRPFTSADAARFPLVVYSPGFPPQHPWLELARAAGADCWGELDFASLFWKGHVLAVTGTNGKTTLTEFLVHALTTIGRPAFAAGNIGTAFSHLVAERGGGAADEMAVCEVSSFQAETLRHLAPDAVLWTNLAEDHLERHPGMNAYFAAKARLAARARRVLAGTSVRQFAAGGPELSWGDRVVWVETERLPADAGLTSTVFALPPQRENFVLAAAWWMREGLPPSTLYHAARTFRLGRHRLAQVAEINGVTYWNDSKATNFHAVEAALTRFDQPVWLIAGGKDKGGDIGAFVRRIAPKVRELLLIGETAGALAAAASLSGVAHRLCGDLAEALAVAAAAARPGEHVLLSPGFASFDQFRNYQHRGEQYEAGVHALRFPSTSLTNSVSR